MRRREFLGVLGGTATAWPMVARAQQPDRMRRPPPPATRDWVNILDFGAVAGGSGDDCVAIQAAIDHAFSTNNPAVLVPSGTFTISSRPIFVDPPGNMRGADGTNGPAWNSGTTYSLNSTVNFGGVPWISIQGSNLNHQPDVNPSWWRRFNWSSATTHAINDIVRRGGVPWKSRQNSNGNHDPLTSPTWWEPYYIQPNRFNFSMRFFGLHGTNHEGMASRFAAGSASTLGYGIIVGPGQGIHVANLVLTKLATGNPSNKSKRGNGVAIAGGPGGATRTTIENMLIEDWGTGIITGFNQDSLCDSNLIVRCAVWGCYIGAFIPQTQNFINNFIECSFSNTIQIWSQNGCSYNVYGGNFSASARNKVFKLLNVSGLTQPGGAGTPFQFTAQVTSPDADLHAGAYERFAVKTAGWGVVPCKLVSWDTNLNLITLQVDQVWQNLVYGLGWGGSTDFSDDIQACDQLYANEHIRIFTGPAKVRGVHIENANCCYTLLDLSLSFAADNSALLEDIYFNSSMIGANHDDPEPLVGCFLLQSVTPFIFINSDGCGVKMRNVANPAGAGTAQINIWQNVQKNSNTVTMEHCDVLIPVILSGQNELRVLSDVYLHQSGQVMGSAEYNWMKYDFGTFPTYKYWPHPACTPLISESILAAWLAGTQSLNGNHPPMMGGQCYQLQISGSSTLATITHIRSDHIFFTAGGSYNKDWRYKGGGRHVYLPISNLRMGQVIILNNGVTGDQKYLIQQVHLIDGGYVVIEKIGGGALDGTTGIEYTGATVGQQPFNVTYDILDQTNFQTPTTGFSMTLANKDTKVILKPVGTLATGTITLCATPRDRQVVEIRSSQQITALTISPNSGQSVLGAPGRIAAGGFISAMYRAADTTWYF